MKAFLSISILNLFLISTVSSDDGFKLFLKNPKKLITIGKLECDDIKAKKLKQKKLPKSESKFLDVISLFDPKNKKKYYLFFSWLEREEA